MNYNSELKEIIMFANAGIDSIATDCSDCLNRVIAKIDDELLNYRATYIEEKIETDNELKVAFLKVATICNDDLKGCNDCPIRKYCNTYVKNQRMSYGKNKYKIVDLFCGAGGLSLGFTQENFEIALANDIEKCCIDTYSFNHPEVESRRIVLGDIELLMNEMSSIVDKDEISLVIGGPPCQGFSMANRQRLIDDPRNKLYKNFVEIVNMIAPHFIVMENVKGMRTVADQVKEDFERIGYQVEYKVLNARDYNVPQNRERIIFIGNCIGVDNSNIFEDLAKVSESGEKYVLRDALEGLRELKALEEKNATDMNTKESGFIIEKNENELVNSYISLINQNRVCHITMNHKARYNNKRDIEIFRRLEQGNKSDDPKIADIMPYKRRSHIFRDKYYKLEEDKPCKTITAHMKYDCNMYIHPTQARGLTPREAARVQSFPDDYYFRGSYTKTYMQIGNSVPPLLGRAIAHVIKKYLHGEEDKE